MPTKREVLTHLTRDELILIAETFDVHVEDRRVKDGLVEAVASSKKATLAAILPDLSRGRLKELCRALHLHDGGKEKAALVERLVNGKTTHANGTPQLGLRLDEAVPATTNEE